MRHSVALRRTLAVAVGLGLMVVVGCQSEHEHPLADPINRTVDAADPKPVAARRPVTRPAAAADAARVVTPQDVMAWSGRGLSDDAILDRLDGAVCPTRVTTADEVHLHDAGVSHDVIGALRAAGTN